VEPASRRVSLANGGGKDNSVNSLVQETDNYISKLIEQLLAEKSLLSDKSQRANVPGKSGKTTAGLVTPGHLAQLNVLIQNLARLKEGKTNSANTAGAAVGEDQENLDPKVSVKADHPLAVADQRQQVENLMDQEEAEEEEEEQPEEDDGDLDRENEAAKQQESEAIAYNCPFAVHEAIAFAREGNFNFGTVLPGQIIEEEFEIRNRMKQPLVIRIVTKCHNAEFDDLDEYVFSLRKASVMEYNDQFYVMLSPSATLNMKVALKVPSPKVAQKRYKLSGEIQVAFKDKPEKFKRFLIEAQVEFPQISFAKELYINPIKVPIVKLAYKNGKKQDYKMPVRNTSNFPVTLEYELLHDNETCEPFEAFCFPLSGTVPANGLSLLTLIVKPLGNAGKDNNRSHYKKMLLAKVKNSCIIFNFLLWIETYG
jgi:hypothetical protein